MPAEIEDERLVGRAGADLAHPHELGEAGDRDQRGVLQRHLPQVAEAGQSEAQHLRRDDAAEHQQPVHADADRRLELAPGDREIGGAEHFRLIGAGDDADRERAGEERRHADEALVADEVRQRRSAASRCRNRRNRRPAVRAGRGTAPHRPRPPRPRGGVPESRAQATSAPITAPISRPQAETSSVMPGAAEQWRGPNRPRRSRRCR